MNTKTPLFFHVLLTLVGLSGYAQTYKPFAISPSAMRSTEPHKWSGIVAVSGSAGSGQVVGNPKVLSTCAHVVMNSQGRIETNVSWGHQHYNSGGVDHGQLRGLDERLIFLFSSYSSRKVRDHWDDRLIDPRTGERGRRSMPDTFNSDLCFIGSKTPLAGGGYGLVSWESSVASNYLLSFGPHMVSGYPRSSEIHLSNRGILHQTGEGTFDFYFQNYTDSILDRAYVNARNMESYGGNSGGGVWAQRNGQWYLSGVFVSGGGGTRLLDSAAKGLYDTTVAVIGNDTALSPTWRNVSFLEKPGYILSISSNQSWTASSKNSWISIESGTSGNGNGEVRYSVSRNTSENPRLGRIEVRSGSLVLSHQVQQAGESRYIELAPENGSHASEASSNHVISVDSNVNWAVSRGTDNWITVLNSASGSGAGTVTYSVDENKTVISRVGTLRFQGEGAEKVFTVEQEGDEVSLDASPLEATLGSEASSGHAIQVICNTNWSAKSNSSWIRIDQGMTGSGNGGIQYSLSGYTSSTAPRSGSIEITAGGITHTVSIIQEARTVLEADKLRFEFGGNSPTDGEITITSNVPWTAYFENNQHSNWIRQTINKPGGARWDTFRRRWNSTGNGSIFFTVSRQQGIHTPREGILTLTGGGITRRIKIVQAGWVSLAAVPDRVFHYTDGTTYQTIQVNGTVTSRDTQISVDVDWIKNIKREGDLLTYQVEPNPTIDTRRGTITLRQSNVPWEGVAEEITISQQGQPPTLSISSELEEVSKDASLGEVEVETNYPWVGTVLEGGDWLTLTEHHGIGDGLIKYHIEENASAHSRRGIIEVKAFNLRHQLVIEQNGASAFLIVSPNSRDVSSGSSLNQVAVVTSNTTWEKPVSSVPWITVHNDEGGSGNGEIHYSISDMVEPEAAGLLDSDFQAGLTEQPTSIALQGDGKLLLGFVNATTDVGGVQVNSLVRLHPDGSLDNSFQAPRLYKLNTMDVIGDILLQPDGKILVAGIFRLSQQDNQITRLIRLNQDGTIDHSFVPHPWPSSWRTVLEPVTIALQPDGKILLSNSNHIFNTLEIKRLNADGTDDATFSPPALYGGTSDGNRRNLLKSVSSIHPLADGTILVNGSFATNDFSTGPQSHQTWYNKNLVKLLPNGAIDTSFRIPTRSIYHNSAIGIMPNDDIVVAYRNGVSKYTSSGGQALNQEHTGVWRISEDVSQYKISDMHVSEDGSIMLACFDDLLGTRFIFELNQSGDLLTDFNNFSVGVIDDLDFRFIDLPEVEKILITGDFTMVSGQPNNFLSRLNRQGSLSRSGLISVEGDMISGNETGTLLIQQSIPEGVLFSLSPFSRDHQNSASDNHEVSIFTDGDWVASVDVDWIELSSSASGTGDSVLLYSKDENRLGSIRTGHIIVQSNGVKRKFIVSQAAADMSLELLSSSESYSSDAISDLTLDISSNTSWTASPGDDHWITLTGPVSGSGNGSVSYSLSENISTSQSREGTINVSINGLTRTFTVTQAPTVVLELSAEFGLHEIGEESANLLRVNSNVPWSVHWDWQGDSGDGWAQRISGYSLNPPGNRVLYYRVTENTSGKDRSVNMVITGGGQERIYTVFQKGPPALGFEDSSVVHAGNALSGLKLNVEANVEWTVRSGNESWITITNRVGGPGAGTVTYSLAPNTTGVTRAGLIVIEGEGLSSSVEVVQGPPPLLQFEFSNSPIFSGNRISGQSVGVFANTPWSADVGQDSWIQLTSGTSGNGNGEITFSLEENVSSLAVPRTGSIVINGGGLTRVFEVTQSSQLASLPLTEAKIEVSGNGLPIELDDNTPQSADGTDFGRVDMNTGRVTRTFRVWNAGGIDLALGAETSSHSDFSVSGLNGRIPPGEFDDFTVVFEPSVAGLVSSVIQFATSDADQSPFNFTVQGEGTTASAFSGAVDGGNNRKWVSWLGWYNDQYWPWIWDYQHGTWLWVVDNGPENVWMWHDGLQRWMWTRTDWYPWVRFAGDEGLSWREQ